MRSIPLLGVVLASTTAALLCLLPASAERVDTRDAAGDDLVVLLRASDLKLSDGKPVERWPDQAVGRVARDKAQDAVQAYKNPKGFDGAAPTRFVRLDAPTFVADAGGGFPAVRFDGESGLAHRNGINLRGEFAGPAADGVTLALVFRRDPNAGPSRLAQLGDVEGTGLDGDGGSSIATIVDARVLGARFQDGNLLSSQTINDSRFHLLVIRLDAGDTYGDVKLSLDGEDLTGDSANPDHQIYLRDEGYCLGYGNDAGGNPSAFFTGDLAEFRYYRRSISDEELAALHDELSETYRLSGDEQ